MNVQMSKQENDACTKKRGLKMHTCTNFDERLDDFYAWDID